MATSRPTLIAKCYDLHNELRRLGINPKHITLRVSQREVQEVYEELWQRTTQVIEIGHKGTCCGVQFEVDRWEE